MTVEDRPVERGGAAVAGGAGMHDQAAHGAPDGLRDGAAQERRDHELRPKQAHRFGHAVVVDRELDGEFVAALGQLDINALGQRVEAGGEQQNSHCVPIPKFAYPCCTLRCELRNEGTLASL